MWAVKLQSRDKGNCFPEQQQQLSLCEPIHVHGPAAHRLKWAESLIFRVEIKTWTQWVTAWNLAFQQFIQQKQQKRKWDLGFGTY